MEGEERVKHLVEGEVEAGREQPQEVEEVPASVEQVRRLVVAELQTEGAAAALPEPERKMVEVEVPSEREPRKMVVAAVGGPAQTAQGLLLRTAFEMLEEEVVSCQSVAEVLWSSSNWTYRPMARQPVGQG